MNPWNPATLRPKLADAAKRLHIGLSQAQLLLAQERFLARLAGIKEGKHFVWKGGSLVLRRYSRLKIPRYTADIDLLASGLKISQVESAFKKAMEVDLDDGFSFSGISKTEMERDTPYGGDRYEIGWRLFKRPGSEILRVDVCTGDDVDPEQVSGRDVFLVDDEKEAVTVLVYPPEFVFAEKLETMVRFKTGNTRFKDFIDMWNLIQLPLSTETTREAVQRCFERRGTPLSPKKWHEILGDKEFQELMETVRGRKHASMELPAVDQIFKEIGRFLVSIEK